MVYGNCRVGVAFFGQSSVVNGVAVADVCGRAVSKCRKDLEKKGLCGESSLLIIMCRNGTCPHYSRSGVNHNGRPENAFTRVMQPLKPGGLHQISNLPSGNIASKTARKPITSAKPAVYNDSQLEMLKKTGTAPTARTLLGYCATKKIILSTVSIQLPQSTGGIGIELVKIPSGEITDLPFYSGGRSFSPVILPPACPPCGIQEACCFWQPAFPNSILPFFTVRQPTQHPWTK